MASGRDATQAQQGQMFSLLASPNFLPPLPRTLTVWSVGLPGVHSSVTSAFARGILGVSERLDLIDNIPPTTAISGHCARDAGPSDRIFDIAS
jgi:hypothetical protein